MLPEEGIWLHFYNLTIKCFWASSVFPFSTLNLTSLRETFGSVFYEKVQWCLEVCCKRGEKSLHSRELHGEIILLNKAGTGSLPLCPKRWILKEDV